MTSSPPGPKPSPKPSPKPAPEPAIKQTISPWAHAGWAEQAHYLDPPSFSQWLLPPFQQQDKIWRIGTNLGGDPQPTLG